METTTPTSVNTDAEDRKPEGASQPGQLTEEERKARIEELFHDIGRSHQNLDQFFKEMMKSGLERALEIGNKLLEIDKFLVRGEKEDIKERLEAEYKLSKSRATYYKTIAKRLHMFPHLADEIAGFTIEAAYNRLKAEEDNEEREREAEERLEKIEKQRVTDASNEFKDAIAHVIRVGRAHRQLYAQKFDHDKWINWLRKWMQDPNAIETVIDSPIPGEETDERNTKIGKTKIGNNVSESATA